MVQVSWHEPENGVESSALIPRMTDEVQQLVGGLTSWELASLTLPGCLLCIAFPRTSHLIASFYRLLLGTLYPAYSSYKAIRAKDNKEYVSLRLKIYLFLQIC